MSPPAVESDVTQFQQARAALFTGNQAKGPSPSVDSSRGTTGVEDNDPTSEAEKELNVSNSSTQFKQARAALFNGSQPQAPADKNESAKGKSDPSPAGPPDTLKFLQKELAQFNQETKALGSEESRKGKAFAPVPFKNPSASSSPHKEASTDGKHSRSSSDALGDQNDSTQFKQAREALFSQKPKLDQSSLPQDSSGTPPVPSPTGASTQFKEAKAQLFSQKTEAGKIPAPKSTEDVQGVQFKEAKALLFSQKSEAGREVAPDKSPLTASAEVVPSPAKAKAVDDIKGAQFKEAKALLFAQKSEAAKPPSGQASASSSTQVEDSKSEAARTKPEEVMRGVQFKEAKALLFSQKSEMDKPPSRQASAMTPDEDSTSAAVKATAAEDTRGVQFREAKAALFNRPAEGSQKAEVPKKPLVTRSQTSSQFHEAKSALINTPQFSATFRGSDAAAAAVSETDGKDSQVENISSGEEKGAKGSSGVPALLTVAAVTAAPVVGCVLLGLSGGLVLVVGLAVGAVAAYFIWLPCLKAKAE